MPRFAFLGSIAIVPVEMGLELLVAHALFVSSRQEILLCVAVV